MEKEIQIKTPDKKKIIGILRGPINKPLIVLVHGFCGHKNEAMHFNAVRYFEKHGFSSFRFNLYSWRKESRKLHECTLKTHGADIDVVLKSLKAKGAKKIYIVGHSYGFPSLLHSNLKGVSNVTSWDGTLLPHHHFDTLPKTQKPVRGRIINEGYLVIMGEKMVKESHKANSIELINKLQKPVKFITVSDKNDIHHKGAQKMFREATVPKEFVIIKGAHHHFTEDGAQEKLYAETVKWFKKY